jgi:hypothetical protein
MWKIELVFKEYSLEIECERYALETETNWLEVCYSPKENGFINLKDCVSVRVRREE